MDIQFSLEPRREHLASVELSRRAQRVEAAQLSRERTRLELVQLTAFQQRIEGFDFERTRADMVAFCVLEPSSVFGRIGDREVYQPEVLGGRPSRAMARWFVRRIVTRSLEPGRTVSVEHLRSRLNAMGLGEHWGLVGSELLAYASEGPWGGPVLVQPQARQWSLAPWRALGDAQFEPLRLFEGNALYRAYFGAANRYWERRITRVGRARAFEELKRVEPSPGVRKLVLGQGSMVSRAPVDATRSAFQREKARGIAAPERGHRDTRAARPDVRPVFEDGIVYAIRVSLDPDRWDSLWLEEGRPVLKNHDLEGIDHDLGELWWKPVLSTLRLYESWWTDISDRWHLGRVGQALVEWAASKH